MFTEPSSKFFKGYQSSLKFVRIMLIVLLGWILLLSITFLQDVSALTFALTVFFFFFIALVVYPKFKKDNLHEVIARIIKTTAGDERLEHLFLFEVHSGTKEYSSTLASFNPEFYKEYVEYVLNRNQELNQEILATFGNFKTRNKKRTDRFIVKRRK